MSRGSPNDNRNKPGKNKRGKSDRARAKGTSVVKGQVKFYGVQACRAIFRHRRNDISRVFVQVEHEAAFSDLLDWARRRGLPWKVVSGEELSRIAATEHHEGVCCEASALKPLPVPKFVARLAEESSGCVVVLEGVENPHNVGAILRTACFFGVSGVVLISRQISGLSGAACRVAEGAAESVAVAVVRDASEILEALKKCGYSLVATTPHQAKSIYSLRWPAKVALLFGAEGGGLSSALLGTAMERIAIPRHGPLESLNVAAAVAGVLTEVRRR